MMLMAYSPRCAILGSSRFLRNAFAATHVGAAVVYGVDRDEPAILAVLDREAGGRDIADGFGVVIPVAESRHLQLQFILVRPEPRHRVVGLRLAQQCRGHGLGLVDGVLHALEPQLSIKSPARKTRTVA